MSNRAKSPPPITEFALAPGRVLAKKYEVVERLGGGWEGEVYRVRELMTGIDRAAKFFFPQRNVNDRAVRFYAQKLHKLRDCPILIQYLTQDRMTVSGHPVTFLVSEYVEGEVLSDFLERQPGHRLAAFEALHLLHALASGVAQIHALREYHGDLHASNVMVRRYGLGFDVRLIDLFHWGAPRPDQIQDDVMGLVEILHQSIGGRRHYAKQPPEIKGIVRGLKATLVRQRFRTAGQVRDHLEALQWERR